MSHPSSSHSFSFLHSSLSSPASDSPSLPSLSSRTASTQLHTDTAQLSSASFYSPAAAGTTAAGSSTSLTVHSSAVPVSSASSSVPLPFPPVRQRSSHIADGITIHSSSSSSWSSTAASPSSAHSYSSPSSHTSSASSSSLSAVSFVHRCLPSLLRVRHSLAVLLTVVTLLLLLSAAVTSVGLPSLPLVTVMSPTSSVHSAIPRSGERIILHTPTSHGECMNSVQGKELLVDSKGVVCDRQDVNADSGCCVRGLDRLSCRSCRHDLHCCHSYEYCISCCIGRQPDSTDSLQTFAECAAVCRTSSASIKHGNVYKHTYHHCYDKLGPVALNASAFAPPAITTIAASTSASASASAASATASALSVVAAELGYSCEATCSNRSLSCHDSLLSFVNTCDALNTHFRCNDCEPSDGGDQPAWVSDKAGPDFPAGRCLVQRSGVSGGLTCEGRHEKTRRLCVCLKEEVGEEVAVEVGHFDGDDDT